jgi:hypothetical protein
MGRGVFHGMKCIPVFGLLEWYSKRVWINRIYRRFHGDSDD